MKVYLVRTPECNEETFKKVHELFISYHSSIKFIVKNVADWQPFTPFKHDEKYSDMGDMGFYDKDNISEQFFVNSFDEQREQLMVNKDDFLVLLTEQNITGNCFSRYDLKRQIIVRTVDWEEYTEVTPTYAIALTIIENIIKILLGIDFNPSMYSYDSLCPLIKSKVQTNAEIRSGSQSFNRMDQKFSSHFYFKKEENNLNRFEIGNLNTSYHENLGVVLNIKNIRNEQPAIVINAVNIYDADLIERMFNFFRVLQDQMGNNIPVTKNRKSGKALGSTSKSAPLRLYKINIENYRTVVLADIGKDFTLPALTMAVYLFFLPKNEGVSRIDLTNYSGELLEIYKKIRPNVDPSKAEKSIHAIVSLLGGNSFDNHCSKIKSEFKIVLPSRLVKYYIISGERGGKYSIKLPKKYHPNSLL